jgi:hypothetical protein
MSDAPLFSGTNSLICQIIGATDLKHKSASNAFFLDVPGPDVIERVVVTLFQAIERNWNDLVRQGVSRSQHNWRWHEPQLTLADGNSSPEVIFQRLLVRGASTAGRTDWANHVPIASGIGGPSAYKHCAIDLVHQRGDGAFDFIELKINLRTDNALYAAFEIVRYGIVWLLARSAGDIFGYSSRTLLDANDVRLCVLAPIDYYPRQGLERFVAGLNAGLSRISAPATAQLSFSFEVLPDGLDGKNVRRHREEQILKFADCRLPFSN